MAYQVIRHPQVENDLNDIAELIGDYAGLAIALSKIDGIERDMEGLADLPHIGSLRHEIYPNLRAMPTAEKGVMSFVVDDDKRTVFVLSITYAGTDWMSMVEKRRV